MTSFPTIQRPHLLAMLEALPEAESGRRELLEAVRSDVREGIPVRLVSRRNILDIYQKRLAGARRRRADVGEIVHFVERLRSVEFEQVGMVTYEYRGRVSTAWLSEDLSLVLLCASGLDRRPPS